MKEAKIVVKKEAKSRKFTAAKLPRKKKTEKTMVGSPIILLLEGKKEGNVHKLILDVKTRWNSTFYMIDRFLVLSKLVSDVLLQKPLGPEMFTARELQQLRETIKLLRPFEKVTLEISSEKYVVISKIMPLLNCVTIEIESIQPNLDIGIELKRNIIAELKKRFGKIEFLYMIPIATILDPWFKNLHFRDPVACQKAIAEVKKLAKNSVQDTSSTECSSMDEEQKTDNFDLWEHHKTLVHKKYKKKQTRTDSAKTTNVNAYLSQPLISLKEDPIQCWEEMKTVYPDLYILARKYLSVMDSSVPSEKLFSKASLTLSKSRNKLLGKRLSKLLFLNSVDDFWFHTS
ncbi:zinc finger BED domain-containing protein 4-like [Sipha flava]|uniref:Zinc finger BED domain-containing protein 4-like n=1 Tax=Sipha flava TaxID=143950 RepID=A0A8B8G739_9HEMI|nr:zinc finger BED domain-containing protein 4-like [Sipha flava]